MSGSIDAADPHARITIDRPPASRGPGLSPIAEVTDEGGSLTNDLGFGGRLRLERERRRITLSSISANTKIGLGLLQGLERDDVSRWPSGIFRRSFIRSYAVAVGLDPDAIAREFLERFPDPTAPHPFDNPASSKPRILSGETVLRLTLADPSPAFIRGRILAEMRRRLGAVAWDLGVLGAVCGMLFVALGHFWMPFAIAMLGYYATSILLLGHTPGVSLFASGSGSGGNDKPLAPLIRLTKTLMSAARRVSLLERFVGLISATSAGTRQTTNTTIGRRDAASGRPGAAGSSFEEPVRPEPAVFLAQQMP